MNYYYLTDGNEVSRPCSWRELRQMVAEGELPETTLVCPEGQEEWKPFHELPAADSPLAIVPQETVSIPDPIVLRDPPPSASSGAQTGSASTTHVSITNVNHSGVKQGAVIGGWLCFLLGTAVMYFSLWAFFIYVPLFLVGFILSIVAMSQRRIFGGIALLLVTLIIPAAQWFITFMVRGDQFLKTHLPPDKLLEYELKKKDSDRVARELLDSRNDQRAERTLPDRTATPAPTPVESTARQAATDDNTSSQENPRGGPAQTARIVELNSDTAPVAYEFKAATPTPRETIAKYVLGRAYMNMDEFSRHDFIAKLDAMIEQRAAETNSDSLYKVSVSVNLAEYDFDKQVFPVAEKLRPPVRIQPNENGDFLSDTSYEVCFDNIAQIDSVPVDLDQARTFAGALRHSRRAALSFIGTLRRSTEVTGNSERGRTSIKRIFLDVQEMKMSLEDGALSVSCKLPGGEAGVAARSDSSPPVEEHTVRRLSADEIGDWSLDRVRDAINEIYGSYGAEFPKADVQAWAERQPWYRRVPGRTTDLVEPMFNDDEKYNLDLLVARRTALRAPTAIPPEVRPATAVALPTPVQSTPSASPDPLPTAAPKPGIDEIAELSPERIVADVLSTNPQMTTANFRSQFSGKVMRYTGTVVRKNPKERLLIFKGGGFMTNAYDVQVSLNEDRTPGFGDVAVGDRLIVVATLERIVPPVLGVGSNSIRLSDGWVYRKVR